MKKSHNASKLYGAGAVAKMLGCYRTYVSQRTNKKGGIKGYRVGSAYVYTQAAVDDFKKIYKPRGKSPSFDTKGNGA